MDQHLIDLFEDPPSHRGPVPLWWWSGGTVTRERVRWQLERFVEGAIHDVVIMNLAPKGPTYGAIPDDPPWFSEPWWDLFAYTCDVAEELDVQIWFYDQIGFSGANVQGAVVAEHPEAAGRVLRTELAEVPGDRTIPLAGRDHLIGIYGTRTEDGWERLDVVNGRIDAAPGTAVRVVSWCETAFDYLDPQACAWLFDAIHGEFDRRVPDRLGTVIAGSFQDELPSMPTWTADFAEEFRRRRGYDLLDHLPSLWERSGTADDAVRADYHLVRTQLAEDAFFRPLGQWHEERGMLVGADQTNPARAGWPTQSSQLYGDYFTTHRWLNAVGSDHEGDARVHSSMADLYGHPRVWIESFHSSGWGGTLEETWDWLLPFFRSGADLYNPHAAYFDTRAGWFEWAPPGTDFRQPYYSVYPQFARAVARTSALLTWGDHVVDVGVLYPSTTGHAVLAPDEPIDYFGDGIIGGPHAPADRSHAIYLELVGTNNWFRHSPSLLDRAGVDFDVIDENSVQRATAVDGQLAVESLGFRTVLLPSVAHLLPGTAEKLLALIEAGGRVIVIGEEPHHVAGLEVAPEQAAALTKLANDPRLLHAENAQHAVRIAAEAGSAAWAPNGLRARRSGDVTVAFVPAAEPNATAFPLRKDPDSLHWDEIDFDPGRYAERTHVDVVGPVAAAEVWDPASGKRRSTPVRTRSGGSRIEVDFGGAPAVFVVWRSGVPSSEPLFADDPGRSDNVADASSEDLHDGWTHSLVSTLDNTWGDAALPPGSEVPLELWRLLWRDGNEAWQDVRATFGEEFLVHGPTSDPPAPLGPEEARAVRAGADLAPSEGEHSWQVHRFSRSRGIDTDQGHRFEPKGFIPEEFLATRAPDPGEQLAVRTVLKVDEPGEYDLTVAAPGTKNLWLDGKALGGDDSPYAMTVPATFAERTAVLEYRVGPSELPAGVHGDRPEVISSFVMLERRGQHVPRPEFVSPAHVIDGEGDLRTRFRTDAEASEVVIVAGSTASLRIELDGDEVARQEKVQYYESDAGVRPEFFTHRVGALSAGEHELRVIAETDDPEHAVYVDAILDGNGWREAVVTGADWTTGPGTDPVRDGVRLVRGLGSRTTHAHAVRRPHPLPQTAWLAGGPEVGVPAVAFEASRSAAPRPQELVVKLPAGTVEAELPQPGDEVRLDGQEVMLEGTSLVLDSPLQRPTELSASWGPRAFGIGGAAWDGPVVVRTGDFTGPFEDWQEQGLGAWSGGMRSVCTVQVEAGQRLRLDLGRVRGAVEVEVDGTLVSSLFCSPFVTDLGDLAPGEHELAVTVLGTLAPRLDSVSPTPFLRPGQLSTGVRGPVRLLRTGSANGEGNGGARSGSMRS
ncbi:glycosyl hydrolase [Brachybacterium sp. AOP29-B2-41]|uniref:glycosyl hydrolase n=1 Tax=Brachybacterium sp. AOP29-B2-41 TaxID=3457704 RepID=UPI004034CC97